ncbi:RNA-directed DNA polymerase [Floridanema aerugineum]|uniref:RNA-directed DNA polymerase n=1 Tax=Floridaenema aerugineum BLCC-F46 TaxID=3153654 RepID=A0ABV4X2H1_9CYAN
MSNNLVREVTKLTDIREIAEITMKVFLQICWKATLSYGDELSLHIGAKIPYSQKSMAGKEKGEWIVGTRGNPWKLKSGGETIATSNEDAEIIRDKIKAIENNHISWFVPTPELGFNMGFSNGYELILIPEIEDDSDLPYWEMFTPEAMVLKVGPNAMWSYTSVFHTSVSSSIVGSYAVVEAKSKSRSQNPTLMNKYFLIEQIKKREVFEKAYTYAIYYRIKEDSYCNFIEIAYYRENKERLFREVELVLDNPNLYEPCTAFSFYMPKSDMFFRRMIYTPFKDLVIKFMFVSVLAELLDFTFVKNCFSSRLHTNPEKDNKAKRYLYKPYYEAFTDFVAWQLAQVENSTCMLKTDISSFYDSISHEYLLSAISKQLNINRDNDFMLLFEKTLKFTTFYYSIIDGKLCETYNRKGIPVGNSAEGFIANIFLNEVDEALFNLGINFGRYVDDFRIFTNNKNEALISLRFLQELLFQIGVNLNSSKTTIIEAQEKIIEFIEHSKKDGVYAMAIEEQEEEQTRQEKKLDKTSLIKEIDSEKASQQYQKSSFSDGQALFNTIEDINNEHKAEQFCKFMNEINPGKNLEVNIFINQMEWLYQLSKKYPKGKYYSWLFVKFLSLSYSNDVQMISLKYLFKVFDDELVNNFIKTRIIHHLVKPRKGALTYIERISTRKILKERIIEHITKLMKISCIALQLNCIYAYYLLFKDHRQLQDFVSKSLKRPIPEPIQQAVYQIGALCYKGSPRLVSFEEILEESEIEAESEGFLFQ